MVAGAPFLDELQAVEAATIGWFAAAMMLRAFSTKGVSTLSSPLSLSRTCLELVRLAILAREEDALSELGLQIWNCAGREERWA